MSDPTPVNVKIAQRKLRALVRAERAIERRFEDIEFDENVLKPAIEKMSILTGALDIKLGGSDILKQLTEGDDESDA